MEQSLEKSRGEEARLGALLFSTAFFFILVSYYLLKPLSRTTFISTVGADNLPYIWICEALVLTALMPFYQHCLKRFAPSSVIFASFWIFFVLFASFRFTFAHASPFGVVSFYIVLDIFSVLMVENFWSLANASFTLETGRSWYGVIASGGLLGGIVGSVIVAALLEKHWMSELDLIWFALIFLSISFIFIRYLFDRKILCNTSLKLPIGTESTAFSKGHFRNYLRCLMVLLLMAQIAEPIIEYLFIKSLEIHITSSQERTYYLSLVFMGTNCLGLFTNLVFLPLLNRGWGWLSGLFLQPLMIFCFTLTVLWSKTLTAVCMLKIADSGLAYSSGRASRELLYLFLPSGDVLRTKAIIDVYGYRVFKISGSLVVLAMTSWLAPAGLTPTLGGILTVLSLYWLIEIYFLKKYLPKNENYAISFRPDRNHS